ncbi:uncharacterized protein GGS22DRAFT_172579 [Annulohypoxylon maeteangense]|uniref:uncharacterized protein n=1 Tax=Annulohypoxylon maeteangense TaxID=1927788 RepID=UPI00200861D4|nr:uncharacterized protein GGS22DRAFT_172579 [Annulohypoxylon maeteangense]KAI0881621.1 hypothetical protein GGS22DRAFT_172579 [Annulohypoxylon maeteangense]
MGVLPRLSLGVFSERSSFGVSLAGKVDSQGHNQETRTRIRSVYPQKSSFIASESDDYDLSRLKSSSIFFIPSTLPYAPTGDRLFLGFFLSLVSFILRYIPTYLHTIISVFSNSDVSMLQSVCLCVLCSTLFRYQSFFSLFPSTSILALAVVLIRYRPKRNPVVLACILNIASSLKSGQTR